MSESYIVLKDCRFLLSRLRMSDEMDATTSNGLFHFVWFLPLNTMFVLVFLYCADFDFNLLQLIWPVNLIVMGIQIECIYLCMVSKRTVATEAMTQLQSLVDQSTFIICISESKKSMN